MFLPHLGLKLPAKTKTNTEVGSLPIQIGGPLMPVKHSPVNGSCLLRVNMPGVGQDGLEVHLEKNTVFFEG